MAETFYPSGRDTVLKTASRWLQFKKEDDNVGTNLWRVHDKLYNLTSFVDKHPGGKEWLTMTEGQDITEAFEAAHVRGPMVEKILSKYLAAEAKTPRRSQYTFKESGFYKTLKKRAAKVLWQPEVGGPGPSQKMLRLQDGLGICAMLLICLTAYTQSVFVAVIAGLVLGMNTSCAHNFFHQADTWRRFYWDLSALSSRDWRVSHMLSHHLHTNTYNDLEISGLEPHVAFLPNPNKNWIQRFLSQLYINALYFIAFPSEYLKKFILVVFLREEKLRPENLLPLVQLLMIYLSSAASFKYAFWLWLVIHAMSGYWLIFTSLIASHHHPDIYHAGDHPREDTDWGLRQMDSTRDVTNKANSFFLVATTFGHHTLHHLFPTVDHSKLHHLYPVLEQTCAEFGVTYETIPQLDMLVGMHLQLMRTEPRHNHIGAKKRD